MKKIVLCVCLNQKDFDREMAELAKDAREYTRRPGEVTIEGTRYIYMSEPDRMKGFHGVEVRFMGRWFCRPDAKAFEEEAACVMRG